MRPPQAESAHPSGAPERNRVHFQVERHAEIPNDRSVATLAFTTEDQDPREAAKRVNEAIAWGRDLAKQHDAIEVRTGGYQTNPISREGRIRHWRARQELLLESGDDAALAERIGALQERLQLVGIRHFVSPERRREAEDALIVEVLEAFRSRADRIRKGLGLGSYEIAEIHVGTSGGAVPPPMPQMRAMAMEADMMAPAIESGSSRVQVSASGSIVID